MWCEKHKLRLTSKREFDKRFQESISWQVQSKLSNYNSNTNNQLLSLQSQCKVSVILILSVKGWKSIIGEDLNS